jgi:hypothetical protein
MAADDAKRPVCDSHAGRFVVQRYRYLSSRYPTFDTT